MTDKITRCPKCSTAFRVSDVHLQSAKGVVRCGSCLTVFDAKAHMETPRARKSQTESSKPSEQASNNAKPSQNPAAAKQPAEAAQSDREDEPSEAPRPSKNLSMSKASAKPEKESYSFDDDIITDDEHYAPQSSKSDTKSTSVERLKDEDQDDADDESWALDLLKDDSEPEVQLKKVVPVKSEPENNSVNEEDDIDLELESELHDKKLDENLGYEQEPEDTDELSEDSKANDTGFGELTEEFASDDESNATRSEESAPHSGQQTSTDSIEADVEETSGEKKEPTLSANKSTEESIKEILAGIEPDPLEVDWEDEKPPLIKRLVWPSLCLLALLALVAQVAWLEFDRLSKIEPYRGLYAKFCPLVGCTLPELRDLTSIKASNLIVRSHPELEGALLVDVILQNNAPFQQRFPSLTLTFSDIDKNPIASRKFAPADYLGGELAGSNIMPTDTPVHIAMELMDPGPNAVSYSIAISD